jgi:hypothetical protein
MKELIPLKTAMIVWNAPKDINRPVGIRVVEHPQPVGSLNREYKCSSGACYSNWRSLTEKERMQCLLQEGWYLALEEHFSVKEIHKAFLRIKEYNNHWSDFEFGE